MKYIVSFSGGKDSTAMLIRLLEENYPVDDIVFFDTGWEFPEIIDHVHTVQKHIGMEISIVKPEKPFTYWMFERPITARKGKKKGQTHRIGNGWPSPMRRWCTRQKVDGITKFVRKKHGTKTVSYIGFAADEIKRTGCGNACAGETRDGVERLYPLIFDWDMDEAACLKFCYDRGFDWGGLYEQFHRVSCFCCPLQRLGVLRTLRKVRPNLWGKMLAWDSLVPGHNKGFYGYKTVHDLDKRFSEEDRQIKMFE